MNGRTKFSQHEVEMHKKSTDAIAAMDDFIETLNLKYDDYINIHILFCDALNAFADLRGEQTEKRIIDRLADNLLSCAKNIVSTP